MNDYEFSENDNSERLDEPIKIRWTGYARGRIGEYNASYSDENWVENDHHYRPSAFSRATARQKTQVVVASVTEADSIRYELRNYHSSQRTWMNSSMDRSLEKVSERLDAAMEERGYAAVFAPRDSYGFRDFLGYRPVEG